MKRLMFLQINVFVKIDSAVGPSLYTDASFAKSNNNLTFFSSNVLIKLSIVLLVSNDVSFNPITYKICFNFSIHFLTIIETIIYLIF